MLLKLGNLGFRSSKTNSFSPTDIDNLAIWLDASDISTITKSAGAVLQWDDKSGNSNHASQGTAANQPTTDLTTSNGLNVIDWDGGDTMVLDTPIPQASGYTILVVIDNLTNTLSNKTLVTGISGSFSVRLDAAEKFDSVRTGQAVLVNGATAVSSSRNILSTYVSSAGNGVYVNGSNDGSNLADAALTQPITNIGGTLSGNSKYAGSIAEIIIYTGVISTKDHNSAGNYLAAKWGIVWTDI